MPVVVPGVSDVAPGCKRESGDDRVKSLGWVYVFGLSSTMLGVLLVPLVGYAPEYLCYCQPDYKCAG